MDFLSLEPKRCLVVAPHADDEVLGAGGLILRATAAGWQVRVLFATVSGFPSAARGDVSRTSDRQREVEDASTILGVVGHDVLFTGEEKHLRLDTVPQTGLVGFIERALASFRPSLVVIPCHGHYHQDHRAMSVACVTALRPMPTGRLPFVPLVLAYGHSAAGWGGAPFAFHPNTFVDITGVIDRKLEALACYRSQLCQPPHPRSMQGVRDHHAAWGAFTGTHYAEAYECLRHVI